MKPNARDAVFMRPLYIHRRQYEFLERRAKQSGRTVKGEAVQLLDWAISELIGSARRTAALRQAFEQLGAEREAIDGER